jgi:hypothetical protein
LIWLLVVDGAWHGICGWRIHLCCIHLCMWRISAIMRILLRLFDRNVLVGLINLPVVVVDVLLTGKLVWQLMVLLLMIVLLLVWLDWLQWPLGCRSRRLAGPLSVAVNIDVRVLKASTRRQVTAVGIVVVRCTGNISIVVELMARRWAPAANVSVFKACCRATALHWRRAPASLGAVSVATTSGAVTVLVPSTGTVSVSVAVAVSISRHVAVLLATP